MAHKVSLSHRTLIAALISWIAGMIFIGVSSTIQDEHNIMKSILKEIGVVIFVTTSMTFIYEGILRSFILEETSEALKKVLDNAMPENWTNIKKSGIVDIYKQLDINKLSEALEMAENVEIRFSKIWIPFLQRMEDVLIDAINNRNCTVKIMLVNPESHEAITKRSQCLPYEDKEMILHEININLKILARVHQEIDPSKRDRLKVKLHKDFISASLIGYGENYILGSYLHGRIATEGIQLRVRGVNTSFYKDIDRHFRKHWESVKEEYIYDLK